MTVAHDVPTQQSSVPTVTPTSPPTPASPRLVAAVVRGQRVAVECCADWCVVDHSAENLANLSDLYHEGKTLALPAPEFNRVSKVLVATIRQDPFYVDADECLPYLAFDATGEGDPVSLQPAAALAFIDQAIAHLERMRAQVQQLAEVREAARQAVER
ncbi:hypothetical protein [Streptomyces sp. NPDC097640]|uniref:DUF6907 domain-containing protein n=1 Tax=Streptomyces sp. NPDC097640 TaxID=3157229 RepID=UPI00332DF36C